VRERFPPASSLLQRSAAVFPAVEINSSFYRPHRAATYARWAAAVPGQFRWDLMRLADEVAGVEGEAWCIFDNTAAGAAAGQALDLVARLGARGLS
jgi:uncharacterized protein YecE (DUF72 family)